MQPGLSSRKVQIKLISATYRICVLCRKTVVHSSGVGANRYTQPVCPRPDDSTRLPNGLPTQSCVAEQSGLSFRAEALFTNSQTSPHFQLEVAIAVAV